MDKSFLYTYHQADIANVEKSNIPREYMSAVKSMVVSGVPTSYIEKVLNGGAPEERQFQEYDLFEDNFVKVNKRGRPVMEPFVETRLEPYLNNFNTQVRSQGLSMIFAGANDVGKTFLGAYICCYLAERYNSSSYYITSRDLYSVYNAGIYNSDVPSRQLYNYCKRCDLLVIDELGKENNTDNFREVLELLIRDRVYANKPMVLITNIEFLPSKGAQAIREKFGNSILSVFSEKFRVVCFSRSNSFRERYRAQWPKEG